MDTKLVRRRVTTVLLVSAVLLVLAGLALLSLVSGSSAEFGESWRIIIFINVAGALTLVLLIVGNLIRMYRDYRNRAAGSRLKTRLVTAFVALVIVPMAIVYSYAVQFLNEGIDSWFDLRVEQGLGDALELSRTALEVRMLDNMEETRGIAAGLYGVGERDMYGYLSRLRVDSGASSLGEAVHDVVEVLGHAPRSFQEVHPREESRVCGGDQFLVESLLGHPCLVARHE